MQSDIWYSVVEHVHEEFQKVGLQSVRKKELAARVPAIKAFVLP